MKQNSLSLISKYKNLNIILVNYNKEKLEFEILDFVKLTNYLFQIVRRFYHEIH